LARLVSRVGSVLVLSAVLASCGAASPTIPAATQLATSSAIPATLTPEATSVRPTLANTPSITPQSAARAASPTAARAIPTASIDPATGLRNVAQGAATLVSGGAETAANAVDGKGDQLWSAGAGPPQSFQITLDKFYEITRIELVVAQTPNGQTTHEIWLGDANGQLKLYRALAKTWTSEGETVTVDVNPPTVTDRVVIRTTSSPSFVAWHQVRVFGKEPTGGVAAGPVSSAGAPEVAWPQLKLGGEFVRPVAVTNAGDGTGRIFVAEQEGRVRIVQDGGLLKAPFLDIGDQVKCCVGEQGFFDVAFPPNYAKKGYFYASYISKNQGKVGDLVVARFHLTANPNVADPRSEEIILIVPQPTEAHHSGHLAFGPKDGYLYVGVGDGGQQGDGAKVAQDDASLLGKILRIDVETGRSPYSIPPSNPFVRRAGARGEIWALGLRNPWQFSFDSSTGDLYIADVGENNYEEIDFQPASSPGGENYGWPIMEGKHCYAATSCDEAGLTLPVVEYDHTQGCAIIGGQVYHGTEFEGMRGLYFFADLCKGRIWGLQRVQDGWQSNLLYEEPFQITSIGADERGNLYVADYSDGEIRKIEAISSP
jgi:glucose/arabinose dehydrogenase